jgi:hypothetical protein
MGGLAAIAAILSTTAGLDGDELAFLDGIGIKEAAMDGLRKIKKVVEGSLVKLLCLLTRPVVA